MRNLIVCTILVLASSQVWGELSIEALEPQPFDSRIVELFELGQGQLLLQTRGLRELKQASQSTSFEYRDTIYIRGADGRTKARVDLPDGLYPFIVPYGHGFAVQQLETKGCTPRCRFGTQGPARIVAYESATDPRPRILYEAQPPHQDPKLFAAPDGQDLYVLDMGTRVAGTQFEITRIDSDGQIAWRKEIPWLETSSFVAIDDGVAFVQYAGEQNPSMVLRAIDRDGRPRWETPIPPGRGYAFTYSTAGFITLPMAPSPHEHDKRRLLNFDTRTGRQIADVLVEPFQYSVGTKDGLLVAGTMLDQPYVGTIGRDGKFIWLRRYVADQQVSEIQRATLTRANELVLVTRERQPTSIAPATSIVVTDRTAASLAEARGGCLDPMWERSVDLASRLRRRGLWIEPPRPEGRMRTSQGCSDHEAQFIAFMQALDTMAPMPRTAELRGTRQTISVRLIPAGQPLRLESYGADRSGYPTAGVRLTLAVPSDGAAEFWRIVETQIQPHLDRMQTLDDRFAQMTGFRYSVLDQAGLGVGNTLPALENAARIVDTRITGIAPAQLAAIRGQGPLGYVQILLRRDGFGPGENALSPLEAADRTFLDIVRENRESAARGELTIRD